MKQARLLSPRQRGADKYLRAPIQLRVIRLQVNGLIKKIPRSLIVALGETQAGKVVIVRVLSIVTINSGNELPGFCLTSLTDEELDQIRQG